MAIIRKMYEPKIGEQEARDKAEFRAWLERSDRERFARMIVNRVVKLKGQGATDDEIFKQILYKDYTSLERDLRELGLKGYLERLLKALPAIHHPRP